MEENNKCGDFFAKCRKEKNLSQTDLAVLLNYNSKNTIARWESGKSFPSDPIILNKLCEIFNLSLEELIVGERKNKENIAEIKEKMIKEYSDKYNKYRKTSSKLFISILISLLLIILSTIFIYLSFIKNQITLYKLSLDNNNFILNDSTLFISNKLSVLDLNKINSKNGEEIETIRLYYFDDNDKERLIISGGNDYYYIEEDNGYNEYNLYLLKIKQLYIDITTNKENYKQIPIYIELVYKNDNIFPKKEKAIGNGESNTDNANEQIEYNEQFLLNEGFEYQPEVRVFGKDIDEKYYFIIDKVDNKIKLSIYEDNSVDKIIASLDDEIIYRFSSVNNISTGEKQYKISEEKECNKTKCSTVEDYIKYINYLKKHIKVE